LAVVGSLSLSLSLFYLITITVAGCCPKEIPEYKYFKQDAIAPSLSH
jgi:hypothetical protein